MRMGEFTANNEARLYLIQVYPQITYVYSGFAYLYQIVPNRALFMYKKLKFILLLKRPILLGNHFNKMY
jgi:hypothetical protein